MGAQYMVKDSHGKWCPDKHPSLADSLVPEPPSYEPNAASGTRIPVGMENVNWTNMWKVKGTVKNSDDVRVIPQYLHSFLVFKTPADIKDENGRSLVKNMYQLHLVAQFARSAHDQSTHRP